MISVLEAAIGRTLVEALSGAAWSAKAFFLMEAMGRSLLLGLAVWAGLRVLGIGNVVAQKAAWVLVLVSALLMPGILPVSTELNWLPWRAVVVIPAKDLQTDEATPKEVPAAQDSVEPARTEADEAAAVTTMSAVGTSDVDGARDTMADRGKPTSLPPVHEKAMAQAGWKVSGWALTEVGYCLVSLLLLVRLLWGMVAALRLWMGAEAAEISEELLPEGRVRVRWSVALMAPVTVGSGIVLPPDYESWDAEKLRIVLAHEQSHVRQADFYLQALAGLYTALFWVSPLGWWLRRRLSDLGEAISDHAGLSRAASTTTYARILLQFAANPHRAEIGVAMARRGVLTERIERLLNEHSFRQAFAGGRLRVMAAVLLVPAALFGATALIRVEAKGAEARSGLQERGQAHPESAADATEPAEVAEPSGAHEAEAPHAPEAVDAGTSPTPAVAPAAPAPGVRVPALEAVTPQSPEPPAVGSPEARLEQQDAEAASTHSEHTYAASGKGYRYSYSSDGDSYALVKGSDAGRDSIRFSGEWFEGRKGELDKARRMAHGDFLWFNRDGKSYVVDDPAVIAQVEAMYKPMEELGRQQEELGKQQEALGRQQEELGRKQSEARVPTPDLTKEMATLNQEMKQLEALKGGTVTQEQLAELQGKLGDLQGRLGELQGQVASKQGDLGMQQGELGAKQGQLGAQQGRLGAEQGRMAREADRKVKSIMDQSLKDGKAKPVQ